MDVAEMGKPWTVFFVVVSISVSVIIPSILIVFHDLHSVSGRYRTKRHRKNKSCT